MKKLITTAELAEYLGVTQQSTRDWRKQGMPYKKLSKLVRFDIDEVMEWLEQRGEEMEEKE